MVKALRVDGSIIDDIMVLLIQEREDNEGAVDVVKRLIKESRSHDIRAQVEKLRDDDCGELHKGQDMEEAVQEVYKKVLALLDGESDGK